MSTDKIRICCPHTGFSPHDFRGGAIYEYNVLKRLCNYNDMFFRMFLPKDQFYEPFPNMKVTKIRGRYNPWIYTARLPFHIQKLYKQEKFDIIRPSYSGIPGPSVLMWKEIFRKKIPSIVTQHHLRDNYLRKVQLAVLRKMDRIITVAPIANELTKEGIKKEKIIFIPNGVDIETYKPEKKADYLQQRYNISTDEFIIGTICGLEKRKRVDLLIKAMARLRNENVKLVIGGKGETMNDLRQLARRLNVSKQVVFAGYIKSEEVKDFYNLFDVFTLPSDLEAMPLSILEAMACKKPAISTNIGAIPLEIKHEHNGFIMEKGNLDQLTNYLKIMIKDPNQTKEMGKNSLKMVHEMFTWDICVEKTHEVFKELVEK